MKAQWQKPMLCGMGSCIEVQFTNHPESDESVVAIRITGPYGDPNNVMYATMDEWKMFENSILFQKVANLDVQYDKPLVA